MAKKSKSRKRKLPPSTEAEAEEAKLAPSIAEPGRDSDGQKNDGSVPANNSLKECPEDSIRKRKRKKKKQRKKDKGSSMASTNEYPSSPMDATTKGDDEEEVSTPVDDIKSEYKKLQIKTTTLQRSCKYSHVSKPIELPLITVRYWSNYVPE